MNNLWSYTQHKHQETELIRRAQDERIASNHSSSLATPAPHPVAQWVGEKLIELGTRLTAEPARPSLGDAFIAETAR